MKLLNAFKEIIYNSVVLCVYSITIHRLEFAPAGTCYASKSGIPKFDTPEKLNSKEIDLSFQKYDPDKDLNYLNMEVYMILPLSIEVIFCAWGIIYSLIKLRYKMNKGLGNILRRIQISAVVVRLCNLFALTVILFT